MIHYYDVSVACEYGVNAAIILQNIYYWCQKNKANGEHLHDGYFWTYNTEEAFATIFPEFTKWQVRNAIKKLKEAGVIITGNYNRSAYDRTLWYAVTEFGESLLEPKSEHPDSKQPISKLQICNLDVEEKQFGNSRDARPIPNNKPIQNITDNKPDDSEAPPAPARKATKTRYGEYNHVLLTDAERDRLFSDYGEADTLSAIKLLDEYIEETGKKYKNHNLTMRRWVFDALKKRKKGKPKSNQTTDFDWGGLAEALEQ